MGRQAKLARGGRAGFSLPELLLVVSILGLGVAASVPLISEQVRAARVRAGSDEFNMSLRAVRMIAVSTRADAVMELVGNSAFRYDDIYGRTRNFTLPAGVTIASTTTPTIVFRPNGSVLGGEQTVVFEVTQGDKVRERWTFAVNPIGITTVTQVKVDP